MSLVRGLTRRNKPHEIEITSPMHIGRAMSQRGGRLVNRAAISSPVALISTSNALLNNAQLINGTEPIDYRNISNGPMSSASSDVSEGDDNDGSSTRSRSNTVTDASSIEGSSPVASEPEQNHLSCYFKPTVDTHNHTASKSSLSRSPSLSSARPTSPQIPQRVPSHSKRAHENLHRKNSIKRMLSPPPSRHGSSADVTPRAPESSWVVEAPKESPFGKELQQLDEVAEEFGQVARSAENDADVSYMRSHGLACFGASDYVMEIEDLFSLTFSDPPAAVVQPDFAGWI